MTGKYHVRRASPTVTTSAYADLDQMGDLMTFTDAFGDSNKRGAVCSVCLMLETGTWGGGTIHFFNASTTITSADNAKLDITTAQMVTNYVGSIAIPATAGTTFMDLNTNDVVYISDKKLPVNSTDGNLYGILQATGAVTFTATDDLTVIVGTETT